MVTLRSELTLGTSMMARMMGKYWNHAISILSRLVVLFKFHVS